MAGLFDDLIPKQAAPQQSGGMFDDLVPRAQPQVPVPGGGYTPPAQQAQMQPPSAMDYLRTGPVGAMSQTVLRAGQGISQLGAHGAATIADLGGYAPNPVGDSVRSVAAALDESFAKQNQSYEGAKQRVVGASSNPRLQSAITGTSETMGNMLNPAGLAGNAVKYAPGVVNAAIRGGIGGAAFGASQPVSNPDDGYWAEKGKQTAIGGATGAATGAVAEALIGSPKRTAPSSDQLRQSAKDDYAIADDAGVVINKDSFNGFVNDLKRRLADEGIDAGLHPKAVTALKYLEDRASENITLKGAEIARRNIARVAKSGDDADRFFGQIMKNAIDDYLPNLGEKDVIAGNAQVGVSALQSARENWSRMSKSDMVDTMMERADVSATTWNQSGKENAIRTEFRSLAKNEAKMRRFSAEEQQAIRDIAKGGTLQNITRLVGKFAPRGVVSAGAGTVVGGMLGPAGPYAVMGAGEAGRALSERMATGKVNELAELLRSGGKAPQALPAKQSMQDALIEALLRGGSNAAIAPLLSPSLHQNPAYGR